MPQKVNELEKLANKINLQYRKEKKSLILKVPTPIILTAKGLIAQQSTVDYVGLLNDGTFIAYEAKETENKTSFPLSNIKEHQLNYLTAVSELNGIAFFLIHFKKIYTDQVFITPIWLIQNYWYKNTRSSIPIADFNSNWLTKIEFYLNKIEELRNDIFWSNGHS